MLVFLLFFGGCAAFSYRYYGLSDVDYSKGKLLGPSENDDLAFAHCTPSASVKYPCVVMMTSEFYRLKQDYEDTQSKLKSCEKGKK